MSDACGWHVLRDSKRFNMLRRFGSTIARKLPQTNVNPRSKLFGKVGLGTKALSADPKRPKEAIFRQIVESCVLRGINFIDVCKLLEYRSKLMY